MPIRYLPYTSMWGNCSLKSFSFSILFRPSQSWPCSWRNQMPVYSEHLQCFCSHFSSHSLFIAARNILLSTLIPNYDSQFGLALQQGVSVHQHAAGSCMHMTASKPRARTHQSNHVRQQLGQGEMAGFCQEDAVQIHSHRASWRKLQRTLYASGEQWSCLRNLSWMH